MKYITQTNVGQNEYFLSDCMHVVKSVKINDQDVEFEVILRLKHTPSEYEEMTLETKYNKKMIKEKIED